MATKIVTPPARIVWGHPLEKGVKTDPKTRKMIPGKDGQPQDVWSCGLAIPVATWPAVEQAIAAEAYRMYPSGNFPRDFSWKIKRETDLDEQRVPYSQREGYAGHVVLSVSTQAFCPSAFKFENGKYRQLADNEFKCGDWVVAELTVDGHQGGVYVNPNMFEVIGYDKEIQRRGGGDPTASFGGRQYQLPPGVSQTPVASSHSVAPPAAAPAPATYAAPVPQFASPAQGAAYAAQPAPSYAAPPAAPLPPPAHDFVRDAGMAPPPQQPPAYAPAPQYGAPPAAAPAYPPAMPGIPAGR